MTERKGYTISDQYALYFVTLTTVGWVDLFTRKEYKDIIIESLKYCICNKGLELYAYVIMPSHCHMILRANESSDGLSSILRDMKKYSSKQLLQSVLKSGKESRRKWLEVVFQYHAKYNKNNAKYQVWLQNNYPKVLLHPKFTEQKLFYIHNNPVEAGIVLESEHYLYSSARNYLGFEFKVIDVNIIDFGVQEGYVFI